MHRSSSILIALALLGGCAATPKDPPLADSDTGVVCRRDYRVGSNLPTTICEAPLSEAERQRQLDTLRNSIRQTGPAGAGG